MIFKYYIDKIAAKLQITNEDEKLFLRDFVNKAIYEILGMYPEKLYNETTVVTVSGENTINLPVDFWKPVAFQIGQIPMTKVNRYDFGKMVPNPSSQNLAEPSLYDIMGVNVSATNVTGPMELVSSNASDITQTLSVYGEKNGVLQSEVINVSGTNVKAFSLTDYTKIYYVAMNEITAGAITVRYTGAGATVGTLIPNNLMIDFINSQKILWVYPWPDGVHTIRIKCYKRPPILVNDGEYLQFLNSIFDDDIVNRGYIEWLYFDGQKELAVALEDRWKDYMNDKIDQERRLDRQDFQQTFSPAVGRRHQQFDPLQRL